jgi:hypothetical protein
MIRFFNALGSALNKTANTFINDSDGYSAKDYLMVTFTRTFLMVTFLVIVLILLSPFFSELDKVIPQLLDVLGKISTIEVTIIGGVFAINTVQEFRNGDKAQQVQVQSNPNNSMINGQAYNSYGINGYGYTTPVNPMQFSQNSNQPQEDNRGNINNNQNSPI